MKDSSKTALIVADMLDDFVTGSLKCDRALRIIEPLRRLIEAARKYGVPVIYSNDHHRPGVDGELGLWGDHAMAGTAGAEVIEQLKPAAGDFVIPKRRYSAFFQTDLHLLLRELGVGSLIITGLQAHICVRHTAADAFFWGYKLVIPRDATEAFTEKDYVEGLEYLARIYGATITSVEELVNSFSSV